MPNRYELKLTRGAMKLERRFDPGPEGLLRPPLGGGGTRIGLEGPSTKGRVSNTWSARSRRTMRFEFGALPWELLGSRPAMITLTYPGEWEVWCENARELHRHREALKERWRRKFGAPVGVWVTEFQRRGAPHLHLYLGLPDAVSEAEYRALQKRSIRRKQLERQVGKFEARKQMRAPGGEFGLWLRTAWWEVVGSELKAHHGRGVDIATVFYSDQAESQTNRTRVAEYFWRESGKWAQKNPPEGFGPLRFYGRWGQRQGFKPVITEAEMDERVGLELRRVLERLREQKMRESAQRSRRKYRKGRGRARGRDGLTVFNVDGRALGYRLLAWAQREAEAKAAARAADGPVFISGAGHGWMRAWSEFEVDVDGPPDDADEREPEPHDPGEWDGLEAHIDRLLELEAEREAAAEAWLEQQERRQVREVRKAELRAREGTQRRRKP